MIDKITGVEKFRNWNRSECRVHGHEKSFLLSGNWTCVENSSVLSQFSFLCYILFYLFSVQSSGCGDSGETSNDWSHKTRFVFDITFVLMPWNIWYSWHTWRMKMNIFGINFIPSRGICDTSVTICLMWFILSTSIKYLIIIINNAISLQFINHVYKPIRWNDNVSGIDSKFLRTILVFSLSLSLSLHFFLFANSNKSINSINK